MKRLWDVLLANGVDPAADGWTTARPANGISADGNTIVGCGPRNGNTEAFVAVIPTGCPASSTRLASCDAADYVVWRKNSGTSGYNDWRPTSAYPCSAGPNARRLAVPEPSSLVLLTLAVPALLHRRRSRPRSTAQLVGSDLTCKISKEVRHVIGINSQRVCSCGVH